MPAQRSGGLLGCRFSKQFLGYFLGFLTGVADQTTLNVVYNFADLVNNICFVLACWSCAKEDSEGKSGELSASFVSC